MKLIRKPVHFKHPIKIYIPVFQKDFDENGDLLFSPTFEYSYADATEDEQMAYSLNPSYVLELNGEFDAVTKSIEFGEE